MGEGLQEREGVCAGERGRVCVRERERERESVCESERERESACVCERDSERACVCVCVCMCLEEERVGEQVRGCGSEWEGVGE